MNPKVEHPANHMAAPIKIAEYLASGRPVLTTRVCELEEWLVDGQDVLFCRAGDPEALAGGICQVLTDVELVDRLSRGGASVARRVCDYRDGEGKSRTPLLMEEGDRPAVMISETRKEGPDRHPRVLVVGHDAFAPRGNGGIVICNLFAGWPTESLAVLDYATSAPALDRCATYWRLSRTAILKGMAGFPADGRLRGDGSNGGDVPERRRRSRARVGVAWARMCADRSAKRFFGCLQ